MFHQDMLAKQLAEGEKRRARLARSRKALRGSRPKGPAEAVLVEQIEVPSTLGHKFAGWSCVAACGLAFLLLPPAAGIAVACCFGVAAVLALRHSEQAARWSQDF